MESTLTATPLAADYRVGFDTLDHEIVVAGLPLEGVLPAWLDGRLIRNGPARFGVGTDVYRHWFDGLAMVHRFGIGGAAVSYANRFLRTDAYCEAERLGRISRSEFATLPRRSLVERMSSLFSTRPSNNANVNVVPFADGYLALTETPAPIAFDGETLETRGALAYSDALAGQITTAHSQHDPERRATFNVVIEVARKSHYTIVRIEDGTLSRTAIASIAVDEPSYLHAFSTTRRYVVLAQFPLVVRPLDLLLSGKAFIDNYHWKPGRATRFHVIDKDTGALAGTYETAAFFAFHHVNAFDDADTVVVDISAYDDAAIIDDLRLDNLRAEGPPAVAAPALRRFRLVPGRGTAQTEALPAAAIELPRIAPARLGQTYRYAYGVETSAGGAVLFDRLRKIDLQTSETCAWSAPDCSAGEPVFVARPGAVDEDDGAVLAVVLDARRCASFLLVLDARAMTELARAYVPHAIPFGFHGMFDGNT
jgi:beta,beta-carotene 9',10'-dioxygenase